MTQSGRNSRPGYFYSFISFFVYILYSHAADRYYIGQCADLKKRVLRHNAKMVPSTKAFAPWVLLYHEVFYSRGDAVKRESYLKKMKSRKFIENLINSQG
ncbi:MAG: GIY-YIG nuclease family protein [Chitinophagaceae bacterium]|nr:GIY-YIG nuclease family protein [Chitinophagaceae bacterium]